MIKKSRNFIKLEYITSADFSPRHISAIMFMFILPNS